MQPRDKERECIVVNINNIDGRNNNNLYHLSPFKINQNAGDLPVLVCDEHFFNEIYNKSVFYELLKEFTINNSHTQIVYGDTPPDENYWKAYHILFNWMSIEKWCHVLDDYELIKLTKMECMYLINSIENTQFMEKLDIAISRLGSVFIKLEHGSTKHDFRPYPVECSKDLYEQIAKSKNCIKQLETRRKDEHYIFMRKWNDNVKKENEIRVFIDNGEISGISQQYIHEVYPFMSILGYSPQLVYDSVQNLWNSIKDRVEYSTCVLDAYIEYGDDIECKLIEINGYGRWGPAGSSLYRWTDDDPINRLEFRIRV